MHAVTEVALRSELKNKKLDEYVIGPNVLITPSAREYLRQNKIKLVVKEEQQREEKIVCEKVSCKQKNIKAKYVSYYSGGIMEKKPEYMTQLVDNILVYKDHPRITLRGKLDSLQAEILELQVIASKKKCKKLLSDLADVLDFTRNIVQAEVLDKDLKEICLLALKEDEIRKMSHNSKRYFNEDVMLFPHYEMGEVFILLNSLRTQVREVELSAIKAFKKGWEFERQDIIRALNRLSSCIHIMMCKKTAGLYE